MARPVIPPPVYLAAGLLAQRLLVRSPRRGKLRGTAGLALELGAGALQTTAMRSFRQQATTIHPLHPEKSSSLVTGGANRITRNPMYVAMAGVLAARAVRLGRWQALIPLAAFVAVIDRVQIPAEEEALRERFGTAYDDYAERVPRWVDKRSLDSLRSAVESLIA